jgi:hypothetical protein
MPKYTQTFASLASQFKTQDDGVNFTITVDAANRKQAARRLAILLYGRCAVASSTLKTMGTKCPHCPAGFGPLRPGAHPTKHGSIAHRAKLGPMQIKSLRTTTEPGVWTRE